MQYKHYLKWKEYPHLDKELRDELENMTEKEITDAFYRNIEFGTAGMRGIMGAGTNRINKYVVAKASEVFANYLLSEFSDANERGVVIAYDNRQHSKDFTHMSANVLASYGLKVYIFDDLRPTPLLSYAVRELNACAGIVITASHNPKEYNGYKVYDETGCQLVPSKIEKLLSFYGDDEIYKFVEFDRLNENVIILDHVIDEKYFNDVEKIKLNHFKNTKDLTIVFTPQHGTGYQGIKTLLEREGYSLHIVESQAKPDPNFSKTLSPNPEEKRAYKAAIELANKVNADIILCTDPDADRIGVGVKHNDDYIILNGNQTGALLIDYLLSQNKLNDTLASNGIIYNTIVTANSGNLVAKKYNIKTKALLTGFKYIGEQIEQSIKENGDKFLFGYEESYGYLISPICRDKDAIQAAVLISEMALYHKNQGLSLYEALLKLYDEIGYFVEKQVSLVFLGESGLNQMKKIMNYFHEQSLSSIGNLRITSTEDYLKQIKIEDGVTSSLTLPSSDVVKFNLSDGSFIAIRPSGTEPKCKFYYNFVGESFEDASNKIKQCIKEIDDIVNNI